MVGSEEGRVLLCVWVVVVLPCPGGPPPLEVTLGSNSPVQGRLSVVEGQERGGLSGSFSLRTVRLP